MSEGLILAAMVAALSISVFFVKLPTGIALLVSAMIGAFVAGEGIPLRHLAEGSMMYLDPMLIVLTSLFFMAVFERSGALSSLNVWMLKKFSSRPFILVSLLTLFVMLPGMFTGLTAPCVLTTGAIAAPVLLAAGTPRAVAGAFIASGAFWGMAAPPVNICAMLIGAGVDMPYIGFDLPLLATTVPLALLSGHLLVGKYFRGLKTENVCELIESKESGGALLYLPFLVVMSLMLGERFLPQYVPHLGIPLIFVIAAVLSLFTGARVKIKEAADWSVKSAMPILALLAGIGMFIQILTLTGARGFIVIELLELSEWQRYVGIAILVPLFGGVSAYGSSVVLGVPILLSMLGQNNVIVAAALSIIASLGDFMPPTRLAVVLAGPVVGEESSAAILKKSLWPIVLGLACGIGMLIYANEIGKLFGLN